MASGTRITPAYAGKTAEIQIKLSTNGDHPRVCGKDELSPLFFIVIIGSPPRMRERPPAGRQRDRDGGITPAYAGKTVRVSGLRTAVGDHPRVCGKDADKMIYVPSLIGSPPRMRERPLTLTLVFLSYRITPAYAGKTYPVKQAMRVLEDHPRVCGKDSQKCPGSSQPWGSPPRMRERPDPAG